MYETKAHRVKNYLYLRIQGLMHMPEARAAMAAVLAEAQKLSPGFAIINDITQARPSSPEIVAVMKKGQAALFATMGASRAIRIISAAGAGANLQFARVQREAKVHYESHLVATLPEALKLLDEQANAKAAASQ